ncbi:MAG TPA: GNAT family protein [Candidatus Saccharimonadales bacterium]|nr:GNAT family protein [Candidatus Saccharimonadales bacterium]
MFTLTVDNDVQIGLLEPRHGEQLFRLINANREHLREWLPWVDSTRTVVDSASFIKDCLQKFAAGSDVGVGMWYQGELVGHMSLMHIRPKHKAEIGYWLSSEYEGRGVMSRAAAALIEYGFDELGLERIEILCRSTNARSQAVAQRLGFTLEGVQRHGEYHDGTYYDFEVYSLLAADRKQ